MKNYQNPMTILEESKEEDVSFNKTLTDQSPIPNRQTSVDDGTRSLLNHMRGNSYQDNSSSIAFNHSAALRGANQTTINGNAKPNFNISGVSSMTSQHLKMMSPG